MEIKSCAHCGCKSFFRAGYPGCESGFVFCNCGVKTDIFPTAKIAVDVWNSRVEQNPSEADRWLAEAFKQRARAEVAEKQRDELAEALDQAKRMLSYSGGIQ